MAASARPSAIPPSASYSPRSQSPSRTQSGTRKPPIDGKSYYGYLFNPDKTPTDILEALLRAIALYIIDNIGDKNEKQLSPQKLAAFYRHVGGNYDALFMETPRRSLSYIWRALGAQHSLQPTGNDYELPSIPTLTLRGFVRWESLQILLGPEEHVPFLQFAVAHWNLKHPDTAEPFPTDLPADALPKVCDKEVDEWHKACGKRLHDMAIEDQKAKEEEAPPRPTRPEMPNAPHRATFAHQPRSAPGVTGPSSHRSESTDYFPRRRPVSYVHVSGPRYSEQHSRPPVTTWHRPANGSGDLAPDEIPRRRSHSDFKPPMKEDVRSSAHIESRPANARRHSYVPPGVASSSETDSDSDVPPHRMPKPSPHSPDRLAPSQRRGPLPPSVQVAPAHRLRHADLRPSQDPRRISFPSEIKQKVFSLLSSGDRQRSSSRERRPPAVRSAVRYGKEPPRKAPHRSDSRQSYTSEDSELEVSPKYTPPSSREGFHARERERERERVAARERERERDRIREIEEENRKDRERERERSYLRPKSGRRASSHADVDRREREVLWDNRDMTGSRASKDLEREVRRNLTGDEMDRDRQDRRRGKGRGTRSPSPAMTTGVSGRRYPR
ncbi:hypothetical protein F5Y16DRAFT_331016 [Xylariaceae sp. FL0255]|nr:hypothetical protein F5Y16DRAFT_331016 [Xylariaceae sp. FL0255]